MLAIPDQSGMPSSAVPTGCARAIRIARVPFVPISGPGPSTIRYHVAKYPGRWLPPRTYPVRPGSLEHGASAGDISQ